MWCCRQYAHACRTDRTARRVSRRELAAASADHRQPALYPPIILTLRREDHSFLLDPIMPRRAVMPTTTGDRSQPYRRAPASNSSLEGGLPAGASLRPGGRLIASTRTAMIPASRSSTVWPAKIRSRRSLRILRQVKHELAARRHYNFNAPPTPVRSSATTCTRCRRGLGPIEPRRCRRLECAIYVAQIETSGCRSVRDGRYSSTDRVLKSMAVCGSTTKPM